MKFDIYTMITIVELIAILLFIVSFILKKESSVGKIIRLSVACILVVINLLKIPLNFSVHKPYDIQMFNFAICFGYLVFGIFTLDFKS